MMNIAVIGAGTMGRGIALTAIQQGASVALHDISEDSLKKAKSYIQTQLQKGLEKGYISNTEVIQEESKVVYSTNLDCVVKHADLVIEAVIEEMDAKVRIFKELDRLAPINAILATNTSTMSPTEIGAQTKRPDKVVAMHFFNPVHKMKLIEIVRALDTSNETVEMARKAGEFLGKTTVEVNESPGFITSRMNCLIGNEAMNMLREGVASVEDIDNAIKLGLNHPMGPLEMADLVGLDSRLRNMEYLHETLGEKYRPSPLLRKYVKAGRLGRKTGVGFYHYS
ncbi:3-hydroxyacyl-CoA dehydrogenase family protein [Shouchella clausii]|uniref:3-hydroxyacyl-CoA dehydrogenase family protein n=1 Tax=Shouchella clausii TaxID=79880 RepID=UPI00128B27FA|nr:3-hydroxyacyl-CoA dehydrogenase NAD-binding domain-containing protein [Shouchella clausii]